jgi:hypothetical protein
MEPSGIAPDFVAEALGDAVEWIFRDANTSRQPSAFSGQP